MPRIKLIFDDVPNQDPFEIEIKDVQFGVSQERGIDTFDGVPVANGQERGCLKWWRGCETYESFNPGVRS